MKTQTPFYQTWSARIALGLALLIVVTGTLAATSGMSEAEKEVREVVGLYFKGAETAEASYFEQAFDVANGHMKFVRRDRETGQEYIATAPIDEVIKGWTSRPPEESWGKIHDVQVLDDRLAHATIEILWRGNIYVDVLALYKANDTWKIVNKTFVSRGPAASTN